MPPPYVYDKIELSRKPRAKNAKKNYRKSYRAHALDRALDRAAMALLTYSILQFLPAVSNPIEIQLLSQNTGIHQIETVSSSPSANPDTTPATTPSTLYERTPMHPITVWRMNNNNK